MRPLVLASASPRRQDLLGRFGMPFDVVPSGSDETVDPGLAPEQVVRVLAQAKARLVAATRPTSVVIGSDTIVVLDGEQIGKPADAADAVATLRRLRGRVHQVYSGVAVVDAQHGVTVVSVVRSQVALAAAGDDEIAAYVATGEPLDKAGSYAVQGAGSRLVRRIDGCVANVVGLPLCELGRLLTVLDLPPGDGICRGLGGERCPRQ